MRPIILSKFRASLAAVSPQPCQRLTEASPKSHRSHAKVTEKPSTRRAANYFHAKPTALTCFLHQGFCNLSIFIFYVGFRFLPAARRYVRSTSASSRRESRACQTSPQILAKFFLPQHLSFRMLAPSYGLKIPS